MVRRSLDIENEDYVILTRGVHHRNALFTHNRTRRACDNRGAFEILDITSAIAPETSHLAVVLNSDNELATSGIRKSAYMLGDLLVVFAGALAIEVLVSFVEVNRTTSFVTMGCCICGSFVIC